ncbi:MAG: hypothetical protein KUL75_09465 [Sterolibacterium sp.]|nr:hypothetical protein [Sterolibacterium sp.]
MLPEAGIQFAEFKFVLNVEFGFGAGFMRAHGWLRRQNEAAQVEPLRMYQKHPRERHRRRFGPSGTLAEGWQTASSILENEGLE